VRRITASGVPLALHCAWSFRSDAVVAPDDDRWIPNTACHAAIEHTLRHRTDTCFISDEHTAKMTDGEIAEVRRKHRAWLVDWYYEQRGHEWTPEVAMAVSPATGETMRLNTHAHRDYTEAPLGWIPGTVDALHPMYGESITLIDWKTGRFAPDADDNGQLATLALASGATHVHAGIAHVTDDGVSITWMELDAFDLQRWRARLVSIMETIDTAEPVPGPHCRDKFCASHGLCPATREALETVAPDAKRHLRVVTNASEIESPTHAREIYLSLRAADAAWDAAKKTVRTALEEYADANGGIDLGNGKTWIRRLKERESIDLSTPESVDALRDALGDEWPKAATLITNKTAIKDAARSIKERTGEAIAAIERRTVEALRTVGAVRVSKSNHHEEVEIKEG
jgi:hypothetical protein